MSRLEKMEKRLRILREKMMMRTILISNIKHSISQKLSTLLTFMTCQQMITRVKIVIARVVKKS